MKIILSYMIYVMLTITNGFGQAQNNASEKQAENTLQEFYSKHFYIWENTPISTASPVTVIRGKLDSLTQKYCTLTIRSEAIKTFEEAEADLLTQNLVGEINENLRVEKDAAKENSFVVFFTATYLDIPSRPVKHDVILNIIVVKEGESYKIDSVE